MPGRRVAALAGLAVALSGCGEAQVSLSPHSATWTRGASMSLRRSYVAAAETGGQIYVAGGMTGETGRPLATFQRYDPRSDSWATLPQLPEPVRAGKGAALDGSIYVVGGTTTGGRGGRQVYAYSLTRRDWQARAPLPQPRFNHAVVASGGRLWVLGGYWGAREHRDVFVYDPARDRWSRGVPLPRREHAFGAVVFHGRIWVIGGRRGVRVLRDVWIYDPAAGRWRRGPSLPRPMELLGAAAEGDEIHAVHERTYQIYDSSTRRWRVGPSPHIPRHALSLFAVNGALYAVGGCTVDLHDSQAVERLALH